jgi:hypothetical protein
MNKKKNRALVLIVAFTGMVMVAGCTPKAHGQSSSGTEDNTEDNRVFIRMSEPISSSSRKHEVDIRASEHYQGN